MPDLCWERRDMGFPTRVLPHSLHNFYSACRQPVSQARSKSYLSTTLFRVFPSGQFPPGSSTTRIVFPTRTRRSNRRHDFGRFSHPGTSPHRSSTTRRRRPDTHTKAMAIIASPRALARISRTWHYWPHPLGRHCQPQFTLITDNFLSASRRTWYTTPSSDYSAT